MAIIGISGKIGSGKDLVGKIIQYLTSTVNPDPQEFELKYAFTHINVEGSQWQIKKFADKLKDIVCLLLGCTRDELEDRVFKESELGKEWERGVIYTSADMNTTLIVDSMDEVWKYRTSGKPYFAHAFKPLTPRLLLQLLGTECGRRIIHPNIWVNALMADYKGELKQMEGSGPFSRPAMHTEFPNWCITDVRFPNEAKAIEEKSGLVIRVERSACERNFTGSKNPLSLMDQIKQDTHESETALDFFPFGVTIENDGSIEDLVEKVRGINFPKNYFLTLLP